MNFQQYSKIKQFSVSDNNADFDDILNMHTKQFSKEDPTMLKNNQELDEEYEKYKKSIRFFSKLNI